MSETIESDYYAFMRFDPENAKSVLSYYVPFFTEGPVLELACGPGVFLSLLREKGIAASGVDIDQGMVDAALAEGHDVVLDDAITHLSSVPDQSLHGLFAAHFLEHLDAETVQDIYREATRVLHPGGVFVAAVPNAACLSVLGYDFWRDPTHVRFYDPVVLEFFAGRAGLAVIARGGNPQNHPGAPPHLLTAEQSIGPALDQHIVELVQRAAATVPDETSGRGVKRRIADAARDGSTVQSRLWAELGQILSVLDKRIQTLQHELGSTRTAYANLLSQLYPPNEVFVVAQSPMSSQEPTSHATEATLEGSV
jgi:SAM-dependent methyltransferase